MPGESFGPEDVEEGKTPEDTAATNIHPVNYPVGKPLEVSGISRISEARKIYQI